MAVSETFNATTSNTSLAGATSTTTTFDVSTKYGATIVVAILSGAAVSTTAGVQVDVLVGYSTGPSYTTQPLTSVVVPVTAATTTTSAAIFLDPGKYQFKITNLDATNGVNYATATMTIDSV